MARYTVLLFREEGVYSAIVPSLQVASHGSTIDEALAMAKEAAELRLEWLASHGEPILEEAEPPIVAAIAVDMPSSVRQEVSAARE